MKSHKKRNNNTNKENKKENNNSNNNENIKEKEKEKEKERSHYEVLEISATATQDEIKVAYRKLALKYHPDKNPKGIDKFREISRANEILSDPEKRQVYDTYGEEVLKIHESYVPTTEGLGYRWLHILGVWFASSILKYFLSIPVEWILVFAASLYLISQQTPYRLVTLLGFVVADIVIYLIIPSTYLLVFCTFSFYIALLAWVNIVKKQWDLSLIAIFVVSYFDYLIGNLTFSTIPKWGWMIFGAHTFTTTITLVALLTLFFQTHPVPETHSVVKSTLSLVYSTISTKITLLPLVSIVVWVPFWILDYYFSVPVESLVIPLFTCAKILLLISRITSMLAFLGLFAVLSLITYFITPLSSYVPVIGNSVLEMVVLLLVYKIQVYNLKSNVTTRYMKSSYILSFLAIMFADRYWRDGPTSWSVLTNISTGCAFVFIFIMLVEGDLDEAEAEAETETEREREREREKTQTTDGEEEDEESAVEEEDDAEESADTENTPSPSLSTSTDADRERSNSRAEQQQRQTKKDESLDSNQITEQILMLQQILESQKQNFSAEHLQKFQELQQQIHLLQNQDDKQEHHKDRKEKETKETSPIIILPPPSSSHRSEEGLKICAACGNTTGKLKFCSVCHKVYYCSKECQAKDWPEHKAACKLEST